MKLYWPCLLVGVLFIGWAHTHTDELPIVLGFLLIASGVLGFLFPKYFPVTALALGPVMFIAETMVGYGILHAPYAEGKGWPWPALIAFVPALAGAAIGAGIRRVAAKTASV